MLSLQETIMSNSWYEILSVLQMMTMLSLSQANLLLLTEASSDSYPLKVSEGESKLLADTTNIAAGKVFFYPLKVMFLISVSDCRRESIDIFLKAAGYLDFAVNSVLPKLPPELRFATYILDSEVATKVSDN